MKIKNLILTLILAIFYPFSLLQKVKKNKITFISLESSSLTRDFKIINKALIKADKYDLTYHLFDYTPGLKNQVIYIIKCIQQLFAINQSHLVLLDFNNFVVSKFKRKHGVTVLQLWHATGAIKKFGNSVPRDYKIKNYDYTIVNSEFFVDDFSKAFNIKKENVKITGIPETDKLFNHQLIIYKPHPLIVHSKYEHNKNIIYMPHESIKKVFAVTSMLVSDYSAIVYDYMVSEKSIIAFVPDLDNYANKPNNIFYYEKEFPGIITKTNQELVDVIPFKEP